jgi:hypothetical protein
MTEPQNTRLIPLTQGKFAIVDEEDWAAASLGKWRIISREKTFYVAKTGRLPNDKCTTVYLHRFITGAEKGQTVDHINHDTLDNRRSNLRICTTAENSMN